MLQVRKVIKRLSKIKKQKPATNSFVKRLGEMIGGIRVSHKFEMGLVSDIRELVYHKNPDRNLSELVHLAVLPYEITWFEFELENTRCAMLVSRKEYKKRETKEMLPLYSVLLWEGGGSSWFVSPVSVIVDFSTFPVKFFPANNNLYRSDKELNDDYFNKHKIDEGTFHTSILLETLYLLNCKNVDSILEDATTRTFKKRKKKRAYKPLNIFDYKILKIRNVSGSAPTSTPQGGKKRAHDVKAHIHTYTTERPLFGKHVGNFIIPAHRRGDIKLGFVAKSYKR